MKTVPSDIHEHYMNYAIALAQRGQGRTSPNPSVGCVIVKNGRVIAVARTGDGGRPHAEARALDIAGANANGADVYVTLEPCAHHGKTPPCAEALVLAGVRRVIIGCGDPDPRVNGMGVTILKAAHIEVVENFVDKDAYKVMQPFLTRVMRHRPFVALKAATSNDGKLEPENGGQWITGTLSRRKVHQLRSMYEAILCGVGTVLADDPELTTRLEGVEHKAPRIILDTHLRIPLDCKMVRTAHDAPLWVFHSDDPAHKAQALSAAGVRLFTSDMKVDGVLKTLAVEGISSVFVEGGGAVYRSFFGSGLVDKLYWFKAPQVKGGADKTSFTCFDSPELLVEFDKDDEKSMSYGEDILEIYKRKA